MKTIKTTKNYDKWLSKLKDRQARERIEVHTRRAMFGNFGDYKGVGGGVIELRIHYGSGYRIYLTERRGEIIFLLVGGTKKTQQADIALAVLLAQTV